MELARAENGSSSVTAERISELKTNNSVLTQVVTTLNGTVGWKSTDISTGIINSVQLLRSKPISLVSNLDKDTIKDRIKVFDYFRTAVGFFGVKWHTRF